MESGGPSRVLGGDIYSISPGLEGQKSKPLYLALSQNDHLIFGKSVTIPKVTASPIK
jgi:hypothetical protein